MPPQGIRLSESCTGNIYVSSPRHSRRTHLIACLLAVAAGAAGCGGDEEDGQAAAETQPRAPSTTSSTGESTAPTTTAPEQPAWRTKRREEAEKLRRRREKQRAAKENKRESARKATTETPPPESEPGPEPMPETEPRPEPEPEPEPPKQPKPPEADKPHELFITENARLKLVRREGITYWQEGTVKGTLAGTIAVKVTIGGPGVTSTFTVTLPNGTIRGRGEASVRPAGSVVYYKGSATITGGTGKYADASGRNLGYSGKGASDASMATAHLTGKLRY